MINIIPIHGPNNVASVGNTSLLQNTIAVPIKQGSIIQGPQGEPGAPGTPGRDGTNGVDGVGVPTGGFTGQVLAKKSATNYDTEWQYAFNPGTTNIIGEVLTATTTTGGYMWKGIPKELPSWDGNGNMFLRTSNDGSQLLWTTITQLRLADITAALTASAPTTEQYNLRQAIIALVSGISTGADSVWQRSSSGRISPKTSTDTVESAGFYQV